MVFGETLILESRVVLVSITLRPPVVDSELIKSSLLSLLFTYK